MDNAPPTSEFEKFYREHQPALVREAIRLAKNRADGCDLAQDTFERAFRSFTCFVPGTNGLAWLRTIMHRLYVDAWRRQGRRGPHVPVEEVDLAVNPVEEQPLWRTVTMDDIRAALAALPAPNRSLLEGHLFHRQPYATLAGRFNIPPATVGTRLFRSRGRLRRVLLSQRGEGPPCSARPTQRAA